MFDKFVAISMEKKVLYFAVILVFVHFTFKFLVLKIGNTNFREFGSKVLEWTRTLLSALFFAFLIMYFILQAFKIPSGSMLNTLLIEDHIFVNKFIYGFRVPTLSKELNPDTHKSELKINMKRIFHITEPKRGDIVVFAFPEDTSKDFVKRCIGIPGDKIEIKDKVLYLNDVKQNEPYVIHSDENVFPNNNFFPDEYRLRDNFGPVYVPKGAYFMMGDNRDRSYDSRFWGFLDSNYIKGKPLVIYWPIKRVRIVK